MNRAAHRRIKRLGIIIGVLVLLLVAGIVFVASKLATNKKVKSDIDRHFKAVENGSLRDDIPGGLRIEVMPGTDAGPTLDENGVQSSPRDRSAIGSSGKSRRSRKRGAPKWPAATHQKTLVSRWQSIRRVAPGTYVIDESLAISARKSPRSFVQGVRAKLSEVDGQPVGFALHGVRQNTAIYAAGLRSGDVITAVNGFKLRSPDEAVAAVTALRFDKQFRVDLQRGRQKRSLYYRLDID